MKRNALERTYKEPLQNCPFHKTWTYIKAHPEICCCLKHECNNDQFCSCMRCNILTRIRIICYPDHYKRDTPCTGELCGRWLPVSTPCVHTSCMSTVVEHAQIPNANIQKKSGRWSDPKERNDHFRTLLLEDEHSSEILMRNLSVGELIYLSNASPVIEEKVNKHLKRRKFDPTIPNFDDYLINHGLYR